MPNIHAHLTTLLTGDTRCVANGKLLRNKIVELALQNDEQLLRLLLIDKQTKAAFFQDLDGILIFKAQAFQQFVQQKAFLPDSYTAFLNKIGLTSPSGQSLARSADVVLTWPYKDCVLEGGQTKEDEQRPEVFWNETLAPQQIDRLFDKKAFEQFTRFGADTSEPLQSFGQAENYLIRGNNLLVLHSIASVFQNKVKLIYIDPPYNTGSDGFNYNDAFSHSTWLTFMKNRLTVARDLLTEDGSIWLNIDDKESHYLKVLCDEIFGRENFVINFIWQKKYAPANDARWFSDTHDHILVFAKNKQVYKPNLLPRTDAMNARYSNPDNDPRGDWKSGGFSVKTYSKDYDYPITTPSGKVVSPPKGSCWQTSETNYFKKLEDNRIYFGPNGDSKPQLKQFLREVQQGSVAKSIWTYDEVGHNQVSRSEIVKLFDEFVFATPKPEKLLKRILELSSNPGDYVLDFFLGSGTTAAVAHKMNRKYIGIDQMDYIKTVAAKRIQKVISGEQGGISADVNWNGGGSFVYMEMVQKNGAYMEAILETKSDAECEIILKNIWSKNQLNYSFSDLKFEDIVSDFTALHLADKKQFLIDLLDKNNLYLPYSEIEDSDHKISKADITLNHNFYNQKL
jgi:adenine-specific DNA-methyltransferase